MAKRKRSESKSGGKAASSRPGGGAISVRQTDDGGWEFVHPRCAVARQEDIEEVESMIDAGEHEIAQDELRWLLSECHDFLVAHKLLGDLAVAAGDRPLARGHYGYAYQLGIKAIDRQRAAMLPYGKPANRAFHEAGAALVACLSALNKHSLARQVADRLLALDPSDPLHVSRPASQGRKQSARNQSQPRRRKRK